MPRKIKKVPLIVWAGIGFFAFGVIRSWRPGWLGRALSAPQLARLREMVPTNFRVKLNSGKQVVLNNLQLAAQIEAGNVVSWVELASSTVTVPPGKTWLVNLKNGDTTTMTSVQLQNAIEAKGVKSYSEITTKQA
jgi:hypothetical protein